VDEVLINLHHLPDLVREHLAARTGPPAVRTVYEPALLGSAGTLRANRDWVAGEEFVLAANADGLTDFDLGTLIAAQRAHDLDATLAVFRTGNPRAAGIVELGQDGIISGFTEKPAIPVSDLANAGIYAFSTRVLDEIDDTVPVDIGYHLLPRLVGRASTVLVQGYYRDIGTAAAYQRARADWAGQALR